MRKIASKLLKMARFWANLLIKLSLILLLQSCLVSCKMRMNLHQDSMTVLNHNDAMASFNQVNLMNQEDELKLLDFQVDDSSRQSRDLNQLMLPYNPFSFAQANVQNSNQMSGSQKLQTHQTQQQSQLSQGKSLLGSFHCPWSEDCF